MWIVVAKIKKKNDRKNKKNRKLVMFIIISQETSKCLIVYQIAPVFNAEFSFSWKEKKKYKF